MDFPVVMTIMRSYLTIVSLLSFIPQYRKILARADCERISICYILCNLIVATHEFATGLNFVIDVDVADSIVCHPLSVGDWLNLTQHGVVWLSHLILFGLVLRMPPTKPGWKYAAIAIYVIFTALTLGVVLFELTIPPPPYSTGLLDRRFFSAWIGFLFAIVLNPLVTTLGALAIIPQAREILSHPGIGALSTTSLALQALVFGLVAVSWTWRMRLPEDWYNSKMSPLRLWEVWYQLVGWAAVDNAIFAAGQVLLFAIAKGHEFRGRESATEGERAPLLS